MEGGRGEGKDEGPCGRMRETTRGEQKGRRDRGKWSGDGERQERKEGGGITRSDEYGAGGEGQGGEADRRQHHLCIDACLDVKIDLDLLCRGNVLSCKASLVVPGGLCREGERALWRV